MSLSTTALVTGVGRESGLGLEVAKQLLARGMTVIITARTLAKAEAAAAMLGPKSERLVCGEVDVGSDASVAKLAVWVASRFGRLDVLINNAGGFYDPDSTPLNSGPEPAKAALDVNCFGAWRMARALIGLLRKSAHPRIVNVGSAAASFSGDGFFSMSSGPGTIAYSISKVALHALTVKLAAELKAEPIRVNAVCPGFTATTPGTEKYGARPVADGAKGIVWAATIPDDGPSGGFFRDGKLLGW